VSRFPLRVSLVALSTLLVAIGLTFSGVLVSGAMSDDLYRRVDGQLQQAVDQQGPASARRPPSTFYVRIALGDGVMVRNNDSGFEPDVSMVEDNAAEHFGPVTVPSVDPKGPDWRVIKSSNPDGESIVAVPLTMLHATLTRLRLLQAGVGAVVVLVIGVLSYLLVRTSLRPLRRVEETAHAIADGHLDERVPQSPPRTEVGSLAASLNKMLAQIQHAFDSTEASEQQARASEQKMRRFIADAGHELRTPLTSIKGFAELYQQGAVTDAHRRPRRIGASASTCPRGRPRWSSAIIRG